MSDEVVPATAGDVLGTPLSVTYKGGVHPVCRPTLAVLDRVEEMVALRAVRECEKQAKYLPAAVSARREKELFAKLDAAENASGGRLWQAEMEADDGARGFYLMLYACLQVGREKAKDKDSLPPPVAFEDMPDLVATAPEMAVVSRAVVRGFFTKVAERRRLPAGAVEEAMRRAEAKAAEGGTAAT